MKAPEYQPPSIACAHDMCKHNAILRRKVNGCMVNLCRQHDEFHHMEEVREYVKSKGLKSMEEVKAFCRAGFKGIGSGKAHGEFLRRLNGTERRRAEHDARGAEEADAVV